MLPNVLRISQFSQPVRNWIYVPLIFLFRIDDSLYANDADMERILHRLTMAAADADIRHKMNVEDEIAVMLGKSVDEVNELKT